MSRNAREGRYCGHWEGRAIRARFPGFPTIERAVLAAAPFSRLARAVVVARRTAPTPARVWKAQP